MTNLQRIAVGLVAVFAFIGVGLAVLTHSNERQHLYPATQGALAEDGR